MARGNWGDGPIDIGGNKVQLPRLPNLPAGSIRLIAIGLVVLFLLLTSYYQVEPEEVGVIQRFGAYARTTEPGPT